MPFATYWIAAKIQTASVNLETFEISNYEETAVRFETMNFPEIAVGLAKWVIGAIGGSLLFKTGLDKYEAGKRRKLMKQQLYEEMLSNYENVLERLAIATSIEGLKQGTPFRFADKLSIQFDAWNNYTSQANRDFFYSLHDAVALQQIFNKFSTLTLTLANDDNPYHLMADARAAIAEVDQHILHRKLNHELIKQLASQSLWAYTVELIEGKRKSYKTSLNPF